MIKRMEDRCRLSVRLLKKLVCRIALIVGGLTSNKDLFDRSHVLLIFVVICRVKLSLLNDFISSLDETNIL